MPPAIDGHQRVALCRAVDLPLPAAAVWRRMSDVRRFLTLDPLHVEASFPDVPEGAAPRPPARLVLRHRLMGIGPDRVGRLLSWREGRGFAVSDLSKRGVRAGFPHICAYAVEPLSAASSRLTVSVRGRWTATWVPRPLARLWLWWVLSETLVCVRREFTTGS
jgi:hypothetical protein